MRTVWHWKQIGLALLGLCVLSLLCAAIGMPFWLSLLLGGVYGAVAANVMDTYHFE